MGAARGEPTSLVDAVLAVNRRQNDWVVSSVNKLLPTVAGRTIAILGLAYTPNTSTLRRSLAVEVAEKLSAQGAEVRGFDPRVPFDATIPGMRVVPDAYVAAQGADALVVLTAWPEFEKLDYERIKTSMKNALLLDPGNFLAGIPLTELGFEYVAFGRGSGPVQVA